MQGWGLLAMLMKTDLSACQSVDISHRTSFVIKNKTAHSVTHGQSVFHFEDVDVDIQHSCLRFFQMGQLQQLFQRIMFHYSSKPEMFFTELKMTVPLKSFLLTDPGFFVNNVT
jgi:hypothetical protein